MAKHKPTTTDLSAQAVALAEFAAKTLVAAEQLGVKKKSIQDFPLDEAERRELVLGRSPRRTHLRSREVAQSLIAFSLSHRPASPTVRSPTWR